MKPGQANFIQTGLIYQIILCAFVVAIAYLLFTTTQDNLVRLGVNSGFDFLWKRAGFDIGQSLIEYSPDSTIARAFLVALINTLLLATVTIIGASFIGLVIGVSRLSNNWLVAKLGVIYVETFRNIPVLLQIFFWYFVVLRSLPATDNSAGLWDTLFLNNRGLFFPTPQLEPAFSWVPISIIISALACIALYLKAGKGRILINIRRIALLILLSLILFSVSGVALDWDFPAPGRYSYEGGGVLSPEFLALAIGLSIYNASYIAEIVRSSFESIPKGQTEAARALALPTHLVLRKILLPQAMRLTIPPLTTVYLNIFKSTSLAAAIAYPEVVSVFVGTVNNIVGQPLEIMAITLIVYTLISLSIALFMNWYNKKIKSIGGL